MKNVLIIKHVDFEGPGRFLQIFNTLNYKVTICEIWKEPLPDKKEFDVFLIMGGPMSVNDVDLYPWLHVEKLYVRSAIESGKKIIGVCLGAQIIAGALGESVFLGEEPEIGWYPVRFNDNRLSFVFHWHGETFDLPMGAELIASSAACENQIFSFGHNVLAFQCHLELDKDALASLLENCRNELVEQRFVMREDEIFEGFTIYNNDAGRILNQMILPFLNPSHLSN